jgi:hypothetical protein
VLTGASWCAVAKGPNVRRTLVLLTKTMQNLANGTRFFKVRLTSFFELSRVYA